VDGRVRSLIPGQLEPSPLTKKAVPKLTWNNIQIETIDRRGTERYLSRLTDNSINAKCECEKLNGAASQQ